MPRKLRVEYKGAIYHVMNRGDRREPIFLDDGDRRLFVETLGQACRKTGWQIHAYCLMSNHFHLVAVSPFVIAAKIDDRQPLTVGTQSLDDGPVGPAVEEQVIELIANGFVPPGDFPLWPVGRLGPG